MNKPKLLFAEKRAELLAAKDILEIEIERLRLRLQENDEELVEICEREEKASYHVQMLREIVSNNSEIDMICQWLKSGDEAKNSDSLDLIPQLHQNLDAMAEEPELEPDSEEITGQQDIDTMAEEPELESDSVGITGQQDIDTMAEEPELEPDSEEITDQQDIDTMAEEPELEPDSEEITDQQNIDTIEEEPELDSDSVEITDQQNIDTIEEEPELEPDLEEITEDHINGLATVDSLVPSPKL